MYRIIEMSGKNYAIELFTSGNDLEDEWKEIETFVNEGNNIIITNDYEQFDREG